MKRLFDNAGTTANHDNWSFPTTKSNYKCFIIYLSGSSCILLSCCWCLPGPPCGPWGPPPPPPPRTISGLSLLFVLLLAKSTYKTWNRGISQKWFSKFNFSIITILYVLHYNLLFVWRVKMNPCLTTWVLGYLQLI